MMKKIYSKRFVHNFIVALLTLAMGMIGLFIYFNQPKPVDTISLSYYETLEKEDLKGRIADHHDQVLSVKDYSVYGQVLKLYKNEFSHKVDPLNGKVVVLENVETQKEHSFTFGSKADEGIRLGELSTGLYSISVYDNFIKKRLYSPNQVHFNHFQTLRDKGKVLYIDLVSDPHLFADQEITQDKPYLYLSISENIPTHQNIDILIDPVGPTYNVESHQVDPGIVTPYIDEGQDSLTLAKDLQKALKKKGLRVEIAEQSLSYYGQEGRLAKGYQKRAKVYLALGLELYPDEVDGAYIMVSPYTAGNLGNTVSRFLKDYPLYKTNTVKTSLASGVLFDGIREEIDLEWSPQLRESGGKTTFAGQAPFAKDNQDFNLHMGMEGIYIQYADGESEQSIAAYRKHRQQLIDGIVKGLLNYYGIEGKE